MIVLKWALLAEGEFWIFARELENDESGWQSKEEGGSIRSRWGPGSTASWLDRIASSCQT